MYLDVFTASFFLTLPAVRPQQISVHLLVIGCDVPQRPDEDRQTCEDQNDILALGGSEVRETDGVSCGSVSRCYIVKDPSNE